MDATIAALVIVLLLIVRFALPLALMGVLCYSLDCLFKRWDELAKLRGTTTNTD